MSTVQVPRTTLDFIAVAILLAFIGIWTAVIIRSWLQISGDGETQVTLSDGLTAAAGAITTLMTTRTASVLGFTITRIEDQAGVDLNASTLTAGLNWATRWAIYVYLFVGVGVVVNWLLLGAQSPEVVAAYSLGILGWLGGAAGVVFSTKATTDGSTRSADGGGVSD
ncbi:hypothetical protein [Agromyces sp. NPDC058110]|uniref:hypothetical protein n=1 Tax=Agromyces sp. NPDC058110 TaxID=3346345 RepID=UPI0036D9EE8E